MDESDSDCVDAAVVGVLSAFCDADDDDIAAASVAPEQQLKDFAWADYAINRDYFGVNGRPPTYNETDFERRFLFPRVVFDRLYRGLCDVPNFQQRPNVTGNLQSSTLQKVVAALRVLAYGEAYDRVDECACLSETTMNETLLRFGRFVIDTFGLVYMCAPTPSDLVHVTGMYEEAGFPGYMGCVDCSHWTWKNCPVRLHGQYQGKSIRPTIVMETVADVDLHL